MIPVWYVIRILLQLITSVPIIYGVLRVRFLSLLLWQTKKGIHGSPERPPLRVGRVLHPQRGVRPLGLRRQRHLRLARGRREAGQDPEGPLVVGGAGALQPQVRGHRERVHEHGVVDRRGVGIGAVVCSVPVWDCLDFCVDFVLVAAARGVFRCGWFVLGMQKVLWCSVTHTVRLKCVRAVVIIKK